MVTVPWFFCLTIITLTAALTSEREKSISVKPYKGNGMIGKVNMCLSGNETFQLLGIVGAWKEYSNVFVLIHIVYLENCLITRVFAEHCLFINLMCF